jgi:molecular chaperone HscA
MLKESFERAGDDMQARALKEQQVEAEQMIAATAVALAQDGELLAPEERTAIEGLVEQLKQSNAGTDHHAIKALIGEVNRATEEFAARRMDQSIRRALAGRKLDEVSL